MLNIPIIELKVKNMEHAIAQAFSEYELELDKTILEAVTKFCTPENINSIVQKEVDRVVEIAIKQEVHNFYLYGEGRETIKKAVLKKLNEKNLEEL
jgi:hypothetical protein